MAAKKDERTNVCAMCGSKRKVSEVEVEVEVNNKYVYRRKLTAVHSGWHHSTVLLPPLTFFAIICLFVLKWKPNARTSLSYRMHHERLFFLAQHANKQCDLINAKKRDSQNLKNVRFQPPVKRKYFYARYSVCTFNFTKNPLNWKMNRAKSHTRTQRRRPLNDTYTM